MLFTLKEHTGYIKIPSGSIIKSFWIGKEEEDLTTIDLHQFFSLTATNTKGILALEMPCRMSQ